VKTPFPLRALLRVAIAATLVVLSFSMLTPVLAVRLQKAGDIPSGVKFQISIPTPIAPIYNNMVPSDRPKLLPPLTQHFIGEVRKIAKALPNDSIAILWDVCQEVLAWENYYDKGPVDFRTETLDVLTRIGDGVPSGIELGYHRSMKRCTVHHNPFSVKAQQRSDRPDQPIAKHLSVVMETAPKFLVEPGCQIGG